MPESGVEGPALKKQRPEANGEPDVARSLLDKTVRIEGEEETPQPDVPVRMDSSSVNSLSKAKISKKRKDPPRPEPCSAADVLYQEIRTLFGEGAVDRITLEGGAFKLPYSYGEEIMVKIEIFGPGGASFPCLQSPRLVKFVFARFWNRHWRRDKGPWGIVVPIALIDMGEAIRVKSR